MSAYRNEARVSLRYELELPDIEQAARRSMAAEKSGQMYLGTLFVALLLTAAELLLHDNLASLTILVVGLLLMVRTYRNLRRRAAQTFEGLKASMRLQEWELHEDGLLLRDENAETRRSWDSLLAWEESATCFLLFIPGSAYYVIPKRAFHSEEERAFLRRQLTEQVPPEGAPRSLTELGAHRWWTIAIHSLLLMLVATVVEIFLAG